MERKIDKNDSSGIYKLTRQCGSAYIGKSYRKFQNIIISIVIFIISQTDTYLQLIYYRIITN